MANVKLAGCFICAALAVAVAMIVLTFVKEPVYWDKSTVPVFEQHGVTCISVDLPCTSWNATVFNNKAGKNVEYLYTCKPNETCPDITGDTSVVVWIDRRAPYELRSFCDSNCSDQKNVEESTFTVLGGVLTAFVVLAFWAFVCKSSSEQKKNESGLDVVELAGIQPTVLPRS